MSGLNIIEQAKLTRQLGGLLQRIQVAEGYFSGVPISTVRIKDASITTAKIVDGEITTAKIANATIENAKFNDLDATKITTGTLDADRIAAGSITATKLSVSSLSAISANLGSVNAGTIDGVTITGGTVRTASSGSRVEMTGSPEKLSVYDGLNERVRMLSGAFVLYGDNSLRLFTSGNLRGMMDASSSSFNVIGDNGYALWISAYNTTGTSDIAIVADDVINLIAPDVTFNGVSKSAIVPIDDEYRALYCAESPDVWFMDFVKNNVDPIFSDVTDGKLFEFQCTNGKKLVISKRLGFSDTRFTLKTKEQFIRNNKFYAS